MRIIVKLILGALILTGCARPDLSLPPMMMSQASAQEVKKISAVIQPAAIAGLGKPDVMSYIRRKPHFNLKKVSFSELPGWQNDKHHEAYKAFAISCKRILKSRGKKHTDKVCKLVEQMGKSADRNLAKKFFESYFVPHKVTANRERGLLTGYYEPEIKASRTKTEKYKYPVYKKPGDLVRVRGGKGNLKGLIAGRKTANGIVPFPTRQQIDQGALNGKGLELMYLEDPIDLFFLHIQGSGRIRLTDGKIVRIGFHAKNGHPYASIGKHMIKTGKVPKDGMSLDAVKRYLKTNPKLRDEILWVNKSYIFFRELRAKAKSASGPIGAMQIPLTPGRSLAVDTRYHQLGMPIYVVSPTMKHHGSNGFRRLMIAQDVGSAIKGSERGDIFWGTGDAAGSIAGSTGNHGNYYVLLPKRS